MSIYLKPKLDTNGLQSNASISPLWKNFTAFPFVWFSSFLFSPFVPGKMLPFYSCTSKYGINLTRCCWCIPARLIFSKKKHSRDAPFDALVFGAHIFIKAQPIRSWWCGGRHNSPRDASKVCVIIWENRSGAHLSLNCCAPTNIQLWLWKNRLLKVFW